MPHRNRSLSKTAAQSNTQPGSDAKSQSLEPFRAHADGLPLLRNKNGRRLPEGATLQVLLQAGPDRTDRDNWLYAAALWLNSNASSSHPVMPPVMILTGRPSFASRIAPRTAPLQCGPAQ